MAQPIVSICIPSYNQTELLQKCLRSIEIQTYKDFEVIVCDDSITDDVFELIQAFKDKLPIVYSRNKPALGSPKNWNSCLELAKGSWIKFLHHDDWFSSPNSLQQFVNATEQKPNADFLFCDSEILNISNHNIRYNRPDSSFLNALSSSPAVLFTTNFIGAPTATFFKKNELRFDENLKYTVDIDFYYRYLLQCKEYAHISSPLIVNTSDNPLQVTTASLNKETQLGEYAYMYNKWFGSKRPSKTEIDLFRSLFKKYKVFTQKEIKQLSGTYLYPRLYFATLAGISRFI